MKALSIIAPLILLASSWSEASQPRRIACSRTYQGKNGSHIIPGGHPTTLDEGALRRQLEAAIAENKNNAQTVSYSDEDENIAIHLEVLVGTSCSVYPAPGCQGWSDGPRTVKYTLSVTDRHSQQTSETSSLSFNTDMVPGKFPTLSLTPAVAVRESDRDVRRILVECGDVAY